MNLSQKNCLMINLLLRETSLVMEQLLSSYLIPCASYAQGIF